MNPKIGHDLARGDTLVKRLGQAEFFQEGSHSVIRELGPGLAALTAGHVVAVVECIESGVILIVRGKVGTIRVTAMGLVVTLRIKSKGPVNM